MRSLAITALLLLSVVLVTPMASAEPDPPRCAERQIAPMVSLNANCGVTVEADLMSCPMSGSWKEHHVGNHVVRYYSCDGPA